MTSWLRNRHTHLSVNTVRWCLSSMDKKKHSTVTSVRKHRSWGGLCCRWRSITPAVQCIVDVCASTRLQLAVSAARRASGFDPLKDKYDSPRDCNRWESNDWRRWSKDRRPRISSGLLESDWNTFVSELCQNQPWTITTTKKKRNRAVVHSLTEDIRLHKHLKVLKDQSEKKN